MAQGSTKLKVDIELGDGLKKLLRLGETIFTPNPFEIKAEKEIEELTAELEQLKGSRDHWRELAEQKDAALDSGRRELREVRAELRHVREEVQRQQRADEVTIRDLRNRLDQIQATLTTAINQIEGWEDFDGTPESATETAAQLLDRLQTP